MENQTGDWETREILFASAVDYWAEALSFLGIDLDLFDDDYGLWAVNTDTVLCTRGSRDVPVWDRDFFYLPDEFNEVSTGRFGNYDEYPGWIARSEDLSPHKVDLLAQCSYRATEDTAGWDRMEEADICWYTHLLPGCAYIVWDYGSWEIPPGGFTSWYSVMLHEIGHLLGLDHIDGQADTPNNVMQSSIMAGDLRRIDQHELEALCKLYGDGSDPCTAVTATEKTSWGQIKRMFR